MKKGGKLHIGGYSNPLLAFTDLRGVDGSVPSLWVWTWAFGFGLKVTGRADEAVGDRAYDIVIVKR